MIKLTFANYSKEKIKKTCQCVKNIFLFLIIIASSQTVKAQFSNVIGVKEEEVDHRTKEEIDADLAAYKKAAQAREAQEELDNYEAMKSSPVYIKASQMLSIEELEDLIEYFGSDESKVYEFRCFNDRETGALFMKSKYRKDKVYYQGEYYYNVYYEMQLKFKDVNSVYESGDKIYFNIGSEGFRQKAKPPGEDWSDYVKNYNDFTMTIYNDDKRKEALNHFKYLVEHPYTTDVDW